jgi:hypothetical protein
MQKQPSYTSKPHIMLMNYKGKKTCFLCLRTSAIYRITKTKAGCCWLEDLAKLAHKADDISFRAEANLQCHIRIIVIIKIRVS